MIEIDTFEKATKEFLNGLDYLGDIDSATLHSIKASALELDAKFTTSLLQEYNKTVRYIKTLAPVADSEDEEDPLLSPQE